MPLVLKGKVSLLLLKLLFGATAETEEDRSQSVAEVEWGNSFRKSHLLAFLLAKHGRKTRFTRTETTRSLSPPQASSGRETLAPPQLL